MAENQPAQNPAPEPGGQQPPAQEPAKQPAEQQPAAQPIQLTDDQKNYLKGQGISEEDFSKPESIVKIINHAQSSQKTAAQIKAEYDKVKNIVNPEKPSDVNPLVQQQPSEPKQQEQQQPGIDPVTAFNLASNLATRFPEIGDELTSGSFYKQMGDLGIPLINNGQVNLDAIIKFGEQRQKEKQLEAKLEELNKPGAIPNAKPENNQPADDAPMTKQIALAILSQDPNHERAQEAKDFLQKSV